MITRYKLSVLTLGALIALSCKVEHAQSASHSEAPASPAIDANRDLKITGLARLSTHKRSVNNIYLQITNDGNVAYLITGISSPSCATIFGVNFDQDDTKQAAELFTHFTLPAKMTLVFPRGGYHLVCTDFHPEDSERSQIKLTFSFLEGGDKYVTLKMEETAPSSH